MSELKPCPFCGTTVVSIEIDGFYRWVECGNAECLASVKPRAFLFDSGNANDIVANDWNTRPIDDAMQARIAELEAMLSQQSEDVQKNWASPYEVAGLKASIAELERRLAMEAERTQELESRLDLYNGNMMDVLQAENERLQSELAALKDAQRWIPVGERLPEEAQEIYAREYSGIFTHFKYSKRLYEIFIRHYTHWMPLHQPPEPPDV